MLKIRKVIDFFYRFRFVFIGAAVVIAATITTLDLSKGTITEESDFEISYTYGDDISYSGAAFMGNVTYEFRRNGDSEWSEEKPKLVGTYEARGKSQGNHGYKYTKVSTFEIKPYETTINLKDTSVDFGDNNPKLAYELLPGDKLENVKVDYESLEVRTTHAFIDLNSIKVVDKDGLDVTSCYSFTTDTEKEITFNKQPITIKFTQNNNFTYTGESFSSDQYEITSGKLCHQDAYISVTGGISVSTIGTHDNTHQVSILGKDKDGNDLNYTENYDITVVDNKITIDKAPAVTISSKPLSKTYDGETFSDFDNPQSLITITPGLIEGHHFKLIGFDNKDVYKTCFNLDNSFTYEIYDKDNNPVDRTLYKSITIQYGKINISKKALTITSEQYTSQFDNTVKTHPVYTQSGLLDCDQIVVDEDNCTKRVEPTTGTGVQNVISFVIKHGEEDVTDCYSISTVWNNISIYKTSLEFTFTPCSYVYDGQSHYRYYANGNDEVYDTEEKKQNAALLSPTSNQLLPGWKYDVRISSSFKIKDVIDKNTKPTVNDVQFTIWDASGNDVSSYYTLGDDIIITDVVNKNLPSATVTEKTLYVSYTDYQKEFDYQSIASNIVINPNDPGSHVIYEGLVAGDYPNVSFGDQTIANKYEAASYSLYMNCQVQDSSGNDMTSNYHMEYKEGSKDHIDATITKRGIVVRPNNLTGEDAKIYDGTNTFTPPKPSWEAKEYDTLIGTENVTIKSNPTVPYKTSDTIAGTYTYTLNQDDIVVKLGTASNAPDVTSSYDIIVLGTGTVKIDPRPVHISNTENSQPGNYIFYDKEEHGAFMNANGSASSEIQIEPYNANTKRGLVSNHTLKINDPQSISAVGYMEVDSSYDLGVEIRDSNNRDVTSSFTVTHDSFYMQIVQTKVTITPLSSSKIYDGSKFERQGYANLGYDTYSNYNSTLMQQLFSVTIESLTNNNQLEPGHMLQLTKYTEDDAIAATDASNVGYPFHYSCRIIDTNHNNKDVTTLYDINAPQGLNRLYVSKAEVRINCNTGSRQYNGSVCTPPKSGQFALNNNKNEPAYVSSTNGGPDFNTNFTFYGEFNLGSYDPSLMYLVDVYYFPFTVTVHNNVNGNNYSKDGVSSNITVIVNRESYEYTITKARLELTTTPVYVNGMSRRWYNGYLAPTDKVYFGDEEMTNSYKVYTQDINNFRIMRNGTDDVTTSCYNVIPAS